MRSTRWLNGSTMKFRGQAGQSSNRNQNNAAEVRTDSEHRTHSMKSDGGKDNRGHVKEVSMKWFRVIGVQSLLIIRDIISEDIAELCINKADCLLQAQRSNKCC